MALKAHQRQNHHRLSRYRRGARSCLRQRLARLAQSWQRPCPHLQRPPSGPDGAP
jgi:hypothetical protein